MPMAPKIIGYTKTDSSRDIRSLSLLPQYFWGRELYEFYKGSAMKLARKLNFGILLYVWKLKVVVFAQLNQRWSVGGNPSGKLSA